MKEFLALCSFALGLIMIPVGFWINAIFTMSVETGWAYGVTVVFFILVGVFSSDLMEE